MASQLDHKSKGADSRNLLTLKLRKRMKPTQQHHPRLHQPAAGLVAEAVAKDVDEAKDGDVDVDVPRVRIDPGKDHLQELL